MAKESPGYRDTLERIRAETQGEMVTVAEAAKISGYRPREVTRRFTGWTQVGPGKRIPATSLARQMCG